MAINLKTTATIESSGVKVLVYGQAGSGKTTLIRTAPAPLILSAEAGLLSLAGRTAHRKRRWQHANDHDRAA